MKTRFYASLFCAAFIALGCSDCELPATDDSQAPLSAVRDGYFETRVSTDGTDDLDELMRGRYYSTAKTIPLSVKFSGTDKKNKTVWETFSGNARVEVRFIIYPLHNFQTASGMSDEGDYYFVETITSLCSGTAFTRNGYHFLKNADDQYCTGFYLTGLKMAATLCDSTGRQVGSFRQIPVPETSSGSKTVTKGFGFQVTGKLSGKNPLIPTLSGNIKYSKTSSAEISDLAVANYHDENGSVKFTFKIQNLPTKSSTAVPSVANHTLDLPSAWIWYVPATSGDQEYTMKFQLSDIVYRAHSVYKDWTKYFESADAAAGSLEYSFTLPAPSRTATGKLTVMNNSTDQFFTDPVITNVDTKETFGDKTNSAYGPDASFSTVLPMGKYSVSVMTGGVRKTLKKNYTLDLQESISVQAFAFD